VSGSGHHVESGIKEFAVAELEVMIRLIAARETF
jgi:hypothetical protein